MSDSLIMSMYEEGRSVKEIAKAMGTAPSEVNALLAKRDQTQTVQVTRHEKHVRDLRRIRALADGMTQKYLETLNAVIDDPDSTADEKANAFGEMDKVIRISKLSSDRVLLPRGRRPRTSASRAAWGCRLMWCLRRHTRVSETRRMKVPQRHVSKRVSKPKSGTCKSAALLQVQIKAPMAVGDLVLRCAVSSLKKQPESS